MRKEDVIFSTSGNGITTRFGRTADEKKVEILQFVEDMPSTCVHTVFVDIESLDKLMHSLVREIIPELRFVFSEMTLLAERNYDTAKALFFLSKNDTIFKVVKNIENGRIVSISKVQSTQD